MRYFLLILIISTSFCGCGYLDFIFDNTAPVITSVSSSSINYSSAVITWTTNEDASSQVEYGTSSSYGSATNQTTSRMKNHSVELTGLDSDTTYYFRVVSEDGGGNKSTSTGNPFHTDVEKVFSKEFTWEYMGQTWTYTTEIDESDYDYFKGKTRVADYSEYVINPDDDEWIENLSDLFIDEAEAKGWDESHHIPFVLAFVQSLPYTSDDTTTGYDDYARYPIETIVDEGGDCEDTSILFTSIVREMGYGAALLLLKDDKHMAAGVQISQSYIDSWNKPYDLIYYPASDGNKYAYCETTGEGWGIGQMPPSLIGTATILDVF